LAKAKENINHQEKDP